MCTTIGFKHQQGFVFGRTLEIGVPLDNNVLFIPQGKEDFVQTTNGGLPSKYAIIGSAFFTIESFGDGINEKGLMGSSNFFPNYGTFAKEPKAGKINLTMANAFDYLLSQCQDVAEVRAACKTMCVINQRNDDDVSMSNHFFFMDNQQNTVVLEPMNGELIAYDNPYGVLTNAPDFGWHATNLKNYVRLNANNIESNLFNRKEVSKLGEGTGMLGIPGDFTPPSRFVRAAYFVSNTDKNLTHPEAFLQAFRILSQFDIPKGSVLDPIHHHADETLYTSVMDTTNFAYHIKCNQNINVQSFYLSDFIKKGEATFVSLTKTMTFQQKAVSKEKS